MTRASGRAVALAADAAAGRVAACWVDAVVAGFGTTRKDTLRRIGIAWTGDFQPATVERLG